MASKSPKSTIKKELTPIGQGGLLRADPADAALADVAASYAALNYLEKIVIKRKEQLKPVLMEASKRGRETEKGGFTLDVDGVRVNAIKRTAAAPNEGNLRALLETRGVPLTDVFDEVKTLVLNPSKLAYLVDIGKLKAAEVESLRNSDFALTVVPDKEFQDMLQEALGAEEKASKKAQR